jgi:hypothetical protein
MGSTRIHSKAFRQVTCGLAKQGKGRGAAAFKIDLQEFPTSDLNFQGYL